MPFEMALSCLQGHFTTANIAVENSAANLYARFATATDSNCCDSYVSRSKRKSANNFNQSEILTMSLT